MQRGLRPRRGVLALAVVLVGAVAVAPVARGQDSAGQRAEALFAEGDALMRVGRVQQARESFERIIAEYPADDFPGLVWRAAARVRLGDLRGRSGSQGLAAAEYTRVLDEEPASEWTSRARLGLAGIVLARGDWVTAADLLERVVLADARGTADADDAGADEATRRLTLLDRFRVRGLVGDPPWSQVRSVTASGMRLDRPVAVAAGADGQLLVIDEGIPAVLLVDAERQGASRLTYNDHARPWWGSDGLPYLPTQRAGVIALGGTRVGFLASEGGRAVPLKDLEAGTRTPAGRWYLIDGSPRRLLRFGSEGDYQGLASQAGEQPVDVAMDTMGRLHVLDAEGRAVIRFLPDGRREGVVVRGTWRRPEALDVDALGNIYVLDRDGKTVDVYDSEGTRIQRLGPVLPGGVELRGPRDITVDGSGQLYIVDRNASAILVCQ